MAAKRLDHCSFVVVGDADRLVPDGLGHARLTLLDDLVVRAVIRTGDANDEVAPGVGPRRSHGHHHRLAPRVGESPLHRPTEPASEQLGERDLPLRRQPEPRTVLDGLDRGAHDPVMGVTVNERRVVVVAVDQTAAVGVDDERAFTSNGVRGRGRHVDRGAGIAPRQNPCPARSQLLVAGHHGSITKARSVGPCRWGVGGTGASDPLSSTWTWNGLPSTELSPATSPSGTVSPPGLDLRLPPWGASTVDLSVLGSLEDQEHVAITAGISDNSRELEAISPELVEDFFELPGVGGRLYPSVRPLVAVRWRYEPVLESHANGDRVGPQVGHTDTGRTPSDVASHLRIASSSWARRFSPAGDTASTFELPPGSGHRILESKTITRSVGEEEKNGAAARKYRRSRVLVAVALVAIIEAAIPVPPDLAKGPARHPPPSSEAPVGRWRR